MKFYQLGLSQRLDQTVASLGYTEPTPIQQQAIPQVLCGRDLFACAQTGTGKTASFLLPLIDILVEGETKTRLPRAIILEPTRELAAQVLENFQAYSQGTDLSAVLLVGGESMFEQDRVLKQGVDVLIVTPGRLIDLFERGKILLAGISIFVIDEADRMLDMGFIPDIERISSFLPAQRQTLLFSATMPEAIRQLSLKYLTNPKEIIVTASARTADTVTQHVVHVEPLQKREALRALLQQQNNLGATIVFCNRKRDIEVLSSSLKRHGYTSAGLHGDMTQTARNETMEDFKAAKFSILVASDIAARGLDIDNLNLVVNFEVPTSPEDYVHRIGRTGRAGNSGVAVTFVTKADRKYVGFIEKLTQQSIPELKITLDPVVEEKEQKKPQRKKSKPEHSQPEQSKPEQSQLEQPKLVEKVKQRNNPGKESGSKQPNAPLTGFGDFVPAFMLRAVV